jgi:hypothetical protein
MRARHLAGWILLLAAPLAAHAQRDAPRSAPRGAAREAVRFVQEFYDWYVPIARDSADSWAIVRARRGPSLRPALVRALEADFAAQAADRTAVVGLDGDPFLNAQEPCERYEAGAATRHGGGYLVTVFAVCGGRRETAPSLVAELAPARGSWAFANVRYPTSRTDLLALLRRLRETRERSRRATPADRGADAGDEARAAAVHTSNPHER